MGRALLDLVTASGTLTETATGTETATARETALVIGEIRWSCVSIWAKPIEEYKDMEET